MTPSQIDLIDRWVTALRSGKYEQGKNHLRSDDNKYCCLGVLCEVAGLEATAVYGCFSYGTEKDTAALPMELTAAVGLQTRYGDYGDYGDDPRDNSLTADNDNGMSFSEIADLIESRPPGLFTE